MMLDLLSKKIVMLVLVDRYVQSLLVRPEGTPDPCLGSVGIILENSKNEGIDVDVVDVQGCIDDIKHLIASNEQILRGWLAMFLSL
jgi:hypothetical protein